MRGRSSDASGRAEPVATTPAERSPTLAYAVAAVLAIAVVRGVDESQIASLARGLAPPLRPDLAPIASV
jgi:hypothetical protein